MVIKTQLLGNQLPKEVSKMVLDFLSLKDLSRLACADKNSNQLVREMFGKTVEKLHSLGMHETKDLVYAARLFQNILPLLKRSNIIPSNITDWRELNLYQVQEAVKQLANPGKMMITSYLLNRNEYLKQVFEDFKTRPEQESCTPYFKQNFLKKNALIETASLVEIVERIKTSRNNPRLSDQDRVIYKLLVGEKKLYQLTENQKNDPEIVKIAVAQDGWALQYASNDLRNKREIVEIAVAQNGGALAYASAALRNNREIVEIAVAQNGWALANASDVLRNEREIVEIAVAQNGNTLPYASEALRNEREIVKIAVAQNGNTLPYASEALRNDREIVKIAVAQNGNTLPYASEALRNDREIVKIAVAQNGELLPYASAALRNDREIVEIAVAQNGRALRYASAALRNDPEMIALSRANLI